MTEADEQRVRELATDAAIQALQRALPGIIAASIASREHNQRRRVI